MSAPLVTIFASRFADRINAARPMSLEELERVIRSARPSASKDRLPLLKLAKFGDVLTEKKSYRHDPNVIAVTGIEGDYDGEEMPMQHAAEALSALGVEAILYTSASHCVVDPPHSRGGPRWRVIVPLAQPIEGTEAQLREQRRHWTGVLNAILGGVLRSESFALSQSFYFGPIEGRPDPEIIRLSGACLDEIENPPAPVFPAKANGALQREAAQKHDSGIGEDRSRDLFRRVARDVRNGLADYELIALHKAHPHAAEQSDPERAVMRCIEKARREETEKNGASESATSEWTPPKFATYGASFDPAQIPLRRWLLGARRSIGEVTVDAGPPGTNKSTLMLTDAVAIATGRKILNDEVHERGAVLFLAGEDARRDVEARIAGILEYYGIAPAELGDRLHVLYLAEVDAISYTLANMAADMAMLNTNMTRWLREFPDIVAIFVDPLMAWHRLVENSNEALQLLFSSLRAVAVQGKRHVGLDHHVTKVTMQDSEGHVNNLAALRGAGVIGADIRWAFTMAKLNGTTAAAYGIPDDGRRRYRRLDQLKQSYAPDDDEMRLLRVESVAIANGESVGVLVEQDMQMVQAEAKERKTAIERAAQERLAAALAKMLTEQRPRTAHAAAVWLITHAPELVAGKKGETLSEFTVRRKLPAMIGTGLWAPVDGKRVRIVVRATPGRGNGSEITFAQPEVTS